MAFELKIGITIVGGSKGTQSMNILNGFKYTSALAFKKVVC
jgi:hypothetical protein